MIKEIGIEYQVTLQDRVIKEWHIHTQTGLAFSVEVNGRIGVRRASDIA